MEAIKMWDLQKKEIKLCQASLKYWFFYEFDDRV